MAIDLTPLLYVVLGINGLFVVMASLVVYAAFRQAVPYLKSIGAPAREEKRHIRVDHPASAVPCRS